MTSAALSGPKSKLGPFFWTDVSKSSDLCAEFGAKTPSHLVNGGTQEKGQLVSVGDVRLWPPDVCLGKGFEGS